MWTSASPVSNNHRNQFVGKWMNLTRSETE